MQERDYIYCEDCEMFVDFFAYDHNIFNAGHEDCNWRYATPDELPELVSECSETGCFA